MPVTTVAGQKAYYAQRQPEPAAGPPIVFVHGAGGTHQHWLYQVRCLPQSPTYALDLPGHGRSVGSGRDSIQAYGDWFVAFLDAAGLEKVVLVGHSMGGGIALELALRHPARVLGLGLVATGARLRVAPAILDTIRHNTETAVQLICDWAFGPEVPPEMVRLGRRQMATIPADVLYNDFAACDGFDVMDQLGQITVPSFVLCGSGDALTPVKYSVYLRDHIPGARLHLVEGAGHMVMVEKPQAVVGALASLVDTRLARPAGC